MSNDGDILSRILVGASMSILLSTLSVACAVTVGTVVGLVAGYFGLV